MSTFKIVYSSNSNKIIHNDNKDININNYNYNNINNSYY